LRFLGLAIRILLLLSRLLAAALLLTGLLTRALVLLARVLTRVLVLLARVLILVPHRTSPCWDVTSVNCEVRD
jgi:hypothetical protein